MRLADVPAGAIVYTKEMMGDDKNSMEVREVFYMRDPDGPCLYDYDVKCARLGIVQGDPNDPDGHVRYVRFGKPSRDPGEADGRIDVRLLRDGGSVWAPRFVEALGGN